MDQAAAGLPEERKGGFLVTIVVPCFNEEEVIRLTYERICAVLGSRGFRLQLIFVDDGSVDRTAEILDEIAASDSRIVVLTFSRNLKFEIEF